MQAYILINCATGRETTLISELNDLPEVVEVNGIWGKYDVFLKVSTTDTNGIEKMVKKLRNHPDVIDTYTMHILYGQGGTIDQE